MDIVERLAMHLALTMKLMQQGSPLSSVQRQCITLRNVIREVLELSEPDWIHLQTVLPESLAELLSEDVVIPDDPSDLEEP